MSLHRRVVRRCALGAALSSFVLLGVAPAVPAAADAFTPGPDPAGAPADVPASDAPTPSVADGLGPDAHAPRRVPADTATAATIGPPRTMRLPLRSIAAHVASGAAGPAAGVLAAVAGLLAVAVAVLAAEHVGARLRDTVRAGPVGGGTLSRWRAGERACPRRSG